MNIQAMFDLKGKTALVTGSSRGIGKAIAQALAAAGAEVIIHGSRPDPRLDETVAEIIADGGKAYQCSADLGSVDETERLAEACNVFTGKLDILVLNASAQSYQKIEDFTAELLQWHYAVNLQSSFLLIKKCLPGMQERKWGRLLSVGSVNQWKPSSHLAIYASSKSALSNLMMNCAKQYSAAGITANNLAPGVIPTDRNQEALQDDKMVARLLEMIPARRFGTVDECAGLALLLCSNAGAYITGADIPVTGGMHL